jgi:hypothetical protein
VFDGTFEIQGILSLGRNLTYIKLMKISAKYFAFGPLERKFRFMKAFSHIT